MPPSPRTGRLEGDALDPHLRLHITPLAHPDAVVQGERFRITVLADGLLRLEWAQDGAFEDHASTLAIHRDLPVRTSTRSTAKRRWRSSPSAFG
jgi:hypothetical protein